MRSLIIPVLLLAAMAGDAVAEPKRAAFFGLLFIDTSLNPDHVEEDRRLKMIEERLLQALGDSGAYSFVDISPIQEKADLYANLAQCNGCDTTLAKEVDAEIAITGEVHKVSNLIISMSIYFRDAETKQLVGGGSTDIRSNTDESWMRGINWLLKNRLLKEQKP